MKPKMTFYTIEPMEAKIIELGGRLIDSRTWREGGDEIEERDFQIGERGVRLQQGIRDGLSVDVKERVDGPGLWRPIFYFAHPEAETFTIDQQMEWIIAHPVPDAEIYFAWLVQQIEKFVGRS